MTLTDANGLAFEHRSFDAFGKPRKGDFGDVAPPTLFSVVGGKPFTNRGFTDHEHLDDAELIHMNGRAYDYNLGRFLSVDPFIQAPGNSQSMNPYSYIMNNPLSGTDPTGYTAEQRDERRAEDRARRGFKTVYFNGFSQSSDNGSLRSVTINENDIDALESGLHDKGYEVVLGAGNMDGTATIVYRKSGGTERVRSVDIMGNDNNFSPAQSNLDTVMNNTSTPNNPRVTQPHSTVGVGDPDNRELEFVMQMVAPALSGKGDIEYCTLICAFYDKSGKITAYGMSNIRTDNSHFGCSVASLSCPAGSKAVSDAHNHPSSNTIQANRVDANLRGATVGNWYNISPLGFSQPDQDGLIYDNRNGWVIPSGTNKVIYFDKDFIGLHKEYNKR